MPAGARGVQRAEGAVRVARPRLRWDALQVALALLVFVQVWRLHDLVRGVALPGFAILCTLAALLVFCLDRDPRRRLTGLNSWVVRPALGILVLAALSVPGSLDPRFSFMFILKDYLRSILLMLLVAASVRGLGDLRRLAWVQILGVALCSLGALVGSHIGSDRRLQGVAFYDVNDLAMLIVCTLPLALYLWRRPASIAARALLVSVAVYVTVALVQTESRGGFLALLAVAVYLLVGFHGISRAKRIGAVALLGMMLVAVASDRYFTRIQTLLHPSTDYNWSGRAETGRMEIWKRGLGYMEAHPVFGVGVAAFPKAEGTLAAEARERQR